MSEPRLAVCGRVEFGSFRGRAGTIREGPGLFKKLLGWGGALKAW